MGSGTGEDEHGSGTRSGSGSGGDGSGDYSTTTTESEVTTPKCDYTLSHISLPDEVLDSEGNVSSSDGMYCA